MTTSKVTRAAAPVIAAFAAAEKAQVKVGDAVLVAATKLSEADIKPFCDAIKTSLETKGFTPNSAKVTTMHIRRVITAVIVDGLEIKPGQTLRGLYDSLPKSNTGGKSHKKGATLPNPANDGADGETENTSPAATMVDRAEKVKAAVTMIFGYCEPDLLSAVQYAAANIPAFLEWAADHAMGAQLAELEKAVTAPAKPARQRKQKAATA